MPDCVQVTLRVEGMTCDGCARHVIKGLESIKGVLESRVPTWQAGKASVLAEASVGTKCSYVLDDGRGDRLAALCFGKTWRA